VINRYTVIGQPIAHSLSPDIHHMFGELTQRRVHYTRTESTPETFADTIINWQKSGGRGCNVTVPFKQQALKLCDRLHPAAQLAGAVNTIHMRGDGTRVGHTTDGTGLRTDLEANKHFPLAGRRILLLGAGGASRSVIGQLLEANPALLHVANRTADRATELAEIFVNYGNIVGGGYEALDDVAPFDLVINATSLSLQGSVPPLPEHVFNADAMSYDMMYGKGDTVFMAWSRSHGAAKVCSGFGMLIEQAADAFLIWEGVRPKTRMVFSQLQDLLDAKQ